MADDPQPRDHREIAESGREGAAAAELSDGEEVK